MATKRLAAAYIPYRTVRADSKRLAKTEGDTAMLLWGSFVRLYKRWRAYERTYEELMRLDDRELADIHVRRGEIDAIARQAARSI